MSVIQFLGRVDFLCERLSGENQTYCYLRNRYARFDPFQSLLLFQDKIHKLDTFIFYVAHLAQSSVGGAKNKVVKGVDKTNYAIDYQLRYVNTRQ